MRIAEVIGKLTLSKAHPSLRGGTWLIVTSLNTEALRGSDGGRGEPFVIYDDLGAGSGDRIAVAEGAEAAAPFLPDQKPVDGYNAAILDTIEVESP